MGGDWEGEEMGMGDEGGERMEGKHTECLRCSWVFKFPFSVCLFLNRCNSEAAGMEGRRERDIVTEGESVL